MSVQQPQYRVCVNAAGECIESRHPNSENISPTSTDLHVMQTGAQAPMKLFKNLSDSNNILFCSETGLRIALPKSVNSWRAIEIFFDDENFDENYEEYISIEDNTEAKSWADPKRQHTVYSEPVKSSPLMNQVNEEGDWDAENKNNVEEVSE